MALSIDSTLRELLADERAVAVLRDAMNVSEEAFNEIVNGPQMQQAMGFSLKQIAGYSGGQISDEMLNAAQEGLGKL